MQWWARFDGRVLQAGPQGAPAGEDWVEVVLDEIPPGHGAAWDFSGDRPRRIAVPPSLARTKELAKRAVDMGAEGARLRYLTPGAGQMLEYEAAWQDARQYLAGQPGAYRMLQADVQAGGAVDLDAAAQAIVAKHEQWELIGAEIRRIRLFAKRAIGEAADADAVALHRNTAILLLDSL